MVKLVMPAATAASMAQVPPSSQRVEISTANLRAKAPPMPAKILAALREDWAVLDPEAEKMLSWIRSAHVFHEFAHARDPFYVHLKGTWQILSCWNQPTDVCRCGLLHSAYSREGFYFRYFDITNDSSRENVRSVVGTDAEQLIYQYCSTWDPEAWGPLAFDFESAFYGKPLQPQGYDIRSRIREGETEHRTPEEIAKFLVGLVADVMDQMCQRFTYRDVYHQEEPDLLWPGNGSPGIFLHWFSRALLASRPYLKVVPPVFNGCTETLNADKEVEAATLYWHLMQKEHKLSVSELEDGYRRVSELNPYVAEPHTMLSQILYRRGAFAEAVHEAACALDIFYQWGSCWDKRHQFAQWVGFSRMAVLRAQRRLEGGTSLPKRQVGGESSADDVKVTYLQDLLAGFDETTETGSEKINSRL